MSEKKTNRISFEDSSRVIKFYLSLLWCTPVSSVGLVILGFFTRALSVAIFVLIVKVFLTVIDPNSMLLLINSVIIDYLDQPLDAQVMLWWMLSGLVSLIVVQYLVSVFNLYLFLQTRTTLLKRVIDKPMNEHLLAHLHICLDHIPLGLDGILKCLEISVFYLMLLLFVFLLNPLAGALMVVTIPLLLALLLLKGRKEIFVVQEMREKRKSIISLDDDVMGVVGLANQQYQYTRYSVINSEFFGGVAIVIMMIVFSLWFTAVSFNGIAALGLVFSIRFAVVYAGELSRHLGRLLQQRTIMDKIIISPF